MNLGEILWESIWRGRSQEESYPCPVDGWYCCISFGNWFGNGEADN